MIPENIKAEIKGIVNRHNPTYSGMISACEEAYSLASPKQDEQEQLWKDKLSAALNELYEQCKHGDEEHQKWLREKFNDYINQWK